MKTKSHIPYGSALAALTIFASSCSHITNAIGDYECNAEGPIVSTTSSISPISAINSSCGISVSYEQCDSLIMRISAPEDVMQLIKATVDNGALTISSTKNLGKCAQLVSVTVKAPDVTTFNASSGSALNTSMYSKPESNVTMSTSSGAVINASNMKANTFNISASSGAVFNIDGLTASGINATASSGAAGNLQGTCSNVSLSASSGSVINASALKSTKGKASASSGGSVSCDIVNPDNIHSSSGGSVKNH